MTRALLIICLTFVSLALLPPLKGQKTDDQWESEKMLVIKKELEELEKQRISYPEHLYQSEAWKPIEEEIPSNNLTFLKWSLFGLMLLLAGSTIWVLIYRKKKQALVTSPVPQVLLQKHIKAANKQLTELQQNVELPFPSTTYGTAEGIVHNLLSNLLPYEELRHLVKLQLTVLADEKLAIKVFSPPGYDGEAVSLQMAHEMATNPGSVLTVEGNPEQGLEFILALPHALIKDSPATPPEKAPSNVEHLPSSNGNDSPTIPIPTNGKKASPALPVADQTFLTKAHQVVVDNLGDASFNAEAFREEMGMSKTQFYRKLHALTAQSPGQYIRTLRLARAEELLQGKHGNVSEIAYEVGFNNLSYFAKCFRKQYGKLPSEF